MSLTERFKIFCLNKNASYKLHSTLVFQFLQYLAVLDEGGRLPPPPGCPRKLYEIMMSCWYVLS